MSLGWADAAGLAGGAIMVTAFAYSNLTRAVDFRLFNALNLAGAALMIASLSVAFNLAAMTLEIVWALIALFGLAKAFVAGGGT